MLLDHTIADTIERIYDAAATPDNWPDVLDRIGHLAEGQGCSLVRFGTRLNGWMASEGMMALMTSYEKDGFCNDSSVTSYLRRTRWERFFSDHEVVPEDLWTEGRYYRELLHAHGAHHQTVTQIRLAENDRLTVCITRPLGAAPAERTHLDRLTMLRPHIGRAALLASRLDAERLRGAITAFDLAGLAACAVDAEGRVLETNERMALMAPHATQDAGQTLRLGHAGAQARLETLLGQLRQTGQVHDFAGVTLAMPAGARHRPAIAHVVPIRRRQANVFSRAAAFVIVAPVAEPGQPAGDLVQGLFDLSPSEGKVMNLMAACMDVSQIAETLNISRETVRYHLKNIFSKTGVSRQTDLASMLASIAAFPQAGGSR